MTLWTDWILLSVSSEINDKMKKDMIAKYSSRDNCEDKIEIKNIRNVRVLYRVSIVRECNVKAKNHSYRRIVSIKAVKEAGQRRTRACSCSHVTII